MMVYVLWHTVEAIDDGHQFEQDESCKLLGIYSSRAAAEERIDRSRDVLGFRDHPEGFYVDEYEVDKDYWIDGFVYV